MYEKLFDLTGRVALVTGGSRGLGKSMARAYAEHGASVMICSRNAVEVEAAVAFVKKNAKRFHVDPKRIALMGESAGAHLVNLAGARDSGGAVYGDRWDAWGHELEERPEAPWI